MRMLKHTHTHTQKTFAICVSVALLGSLWWSPRSLHLRAVELLETIENHAVQLNATQGATKLNSDDVASVVRATKINSDDVASAVLNSTARFDSTKRLCAKAAQSHFMKAPGDWIFHSGLPNERGLHRFKKIENFSHEEMWPKHFAKINHYTSAFIDVGCNVGSNTDMWLESFPKQKSQNVYCFEANRLNSRFLLEKYHKEPRVRVVESAVSDTPGRVDIYSPIARVGATGGGIGKRGGGDVFIGSVPVIRLSDFVFTNLTSAEQIGIAIKIDTEGYDFRILQGMKELLSRKAIDVLQLECNFNKWCRVDRDRSVFPTWSACYEAQASHGDSGRVLPAMVQFLEQYGYQAFLMGPVYVPLNGFQFSLPGKALDANRAGALAFANILALPMGAAWATEVVHDFICTKSYYFQEYLGSKTYSAAYDTCRRLHGPHEQCADRAHKARQHRFKDIVILPDAMQA